MNTTMDHDSEVANILMDLARSPSSSRDSNMNTTMEVDLEVVNTSLEPARSPSLSRDSNMNTTTEVDLEAVNILLDLAHSSADQPRQRQYDLPDVARALANVEQTFSQSREIARSLSLRTQTTETLGTMPRDGGKCVTMSNQQLKLFQLWIMACLLQTRPKTNETTACKILRWAWRITRSRVRHPRWNKRKIQNQTAQSILVSKMEQAKCGIAKKESSDVSNVHYDGNLLLQRTRSTRANSF